MNGRWWRAYDEAVDDPKLQCLSDECFRFWFNLCCVCSAFGGNLPNEKHLAFKLRMQPRKAARLLRELRNAGLIDEDAHGVRMHNWNGRQFKSDVTDPTNAERQKRYRRRHAVTGNGVTVTAPRVQSTEAETERKKERDPADAGSSSESSYAFESGVIRLKQEDFDRWRKHFSYLDLGAELLGLTEWASQQAKWFPAVSGALAKRNREAKIATEKQKNTPAFKYMSGIEGVI